MSNPATKGRNALARVREATDYAVRHAEDGTIAGQFFNCMLSTMFQPVFQAKTGEVAGHAAYVRSALNEDSPLSPWKVLSLTEGDAPLVRFDRLCRVVHALNYFSDASQRSYLFVAVQPRLLESVKDDHGRAFKRVLDIIGVETTRVVIEIPAEANRNWKLLQHVTRNYKAHGYRIAINYDNASENWLAELASFYPLYPDIVRLEPSILLRHGGETVVNTVHQFGAKVLVHDIETQGQLAAAVRARIHFLQGPLFGAPTRKIVTPALASFMEAVELQAPHGAFPRSSPRPSFPDMAVIDHEPV